MARAPVARRGGARALALRGLPSMPMPGITCASAHGTRKQARSLILAQTSGLGGVGSDGDLLPKEFHARAAGVGSGTGAERDVAQSCDGTRLGDGVQVVPGLGREIAHALRCVHASPRAPRLPNRPPQDRGGARLVSAVRLTDRNSRAGLRYDDIKIEQNPDVVKALERIPADELINRCVCGWCSARVSRRVLPRLNLPRYPATAGSSARSTLTSRARGCRRRCRLCRPLSRSDWLAPRAAFPSVSSLTFAPPQPYLTHEEDEAKQLRQERELLNGPCPWL